MANLSEKPLETEEGRTESVEAGEDKGGPDTAPEQLETQEKDAKGQDRDPNLDEKPVDKPIEEKEAETKPVTRGSIDTRREYGLETRGNTDLMRFSPSVYLKHVYSLKHGFWCR